MKKALPLIAILCMALVLFAGCNSDQQPVETPCEHNWVDATCTTPKTCSLCNAIDGEPNGHVEETVAGTAATCIEAGKTDGKKCSACGLITVEQTVINVLDHNPEADDGDCATEVKCTNEGCGAIVLSAASSHTPRADDGDVTTPVKCANEGCEQIIVPAKEAITLTIPTFENGAVVADKMNYAIGDTVKLTINPNFGYASKLYINGAPLMFDWNNNIYTFVAENDTYVISGTFEQNINLNPSDVTRWDTMNHAHGVISTQYLADHNHESWWFDFNGEYTAISVKAKNYLSVEDSKDGDGKIGFSFVLRITLNNGKVYAFRIYNDKGTYAFSEFGTSGTGWGHWKALDSDMATALNGDGVDFKLERTGANVLTLSINGTEILTYTMEGVTIENQVTSVGLRHYGNINMQVDIPFVLTSACNHTWINATCTAPMTCSECNITIGEKLEHTYTDYVSNNDATCTEDGTKTGTCVCGKKDTVADEDSALGHSEETVAGKAATCTENGLSDGKKCSVCGITTLAQSVLPAKGHEDDDNNNACDVCGANVCINHVEETVAGKAATCTESGLTDGKKCSICESVILAQEVIPAKNHKASADDGNCETAVKCANAGCDYIFVEAMTHTPAADDGDVTTAVKCTNAGCKQILVPAKEAITLTIPTFENGTVTQDKKNYAAGDTVTLTVSANKDYAQKLYINGKPILVDTNSKYSFVAEAGKTYTITGEFVYVKGNWFWTAEYVLLNQAHGVFHSPVPAGGEKNGELVPTFGKCYGGKVLVTDPSGGTKKDFAIVLQMTFSDGQKAKVRLVNKEGTGTYMVQSMDGIFGTWKWYYDLTPEENAAVANGEGVWFSLVREGTDVKIAVNGSVKTRGDVTINIPENVVLEQFKVTTYNFSYAINVPYEFFMIED